MSALTEELVESIESFRERARSWLDDNMPRLETGTSQTDLMDADDDGRRARGLQRQLFEAGFAGIVFPKELGGLGLTPEHQRAFAEEAGAYEMPLRFDIPTLTILAPTILDYGTPRQRQLHIPAMLRGEELWVQFLSEPTGGSDLAGSITQATRDGDVWILNGSKTWSSGAHRADYGLCLARTDWNAPKHRGLTMFIVPAQHPGVQIERIRRVDDSTEFCQEFFDDVPLALDQVVGEVNQGWAVATRLLEHERTATGGGSPFGNCRSRGPTVEPQRDLIELAQARGVSSDHHVRQLVAEAHVLDAVHGHLIERVSNGVRSGALPPASSSILKLFTGMKHMRRGTIALDVAGERAAVWDEADEAGEPTGIAFLSRQARCLAGGSNEMQRNIISERLLGMPRDLTTDPNTPFSEVRRNSFARRGTDR